MPRGHMTSLRLAESVDNLLGAVPESAQHTQKMVFHRALVIFAGFVLLETLGEFVGAVTYFQDRFRRGRGVPR